jgi:hypothetical protein
VPTFAMLPNTILALGDSCMSMAPIEQKQGQGNG